MTTLLLEIGTEEMPASYVPPALAQLAELARARLQAERLVFEEAHTWGTPRRIALFVTGLAERQAPTVREVRGPAVREAFAANGEPTQAAIGFARSQGMPVSELRVKKTDAGEYVIATFRDEGRSTAELLPDLLPQLITSLSFPKTMRWGSGTIRFARPIRWLVALLDDQVVPMAVGDVAAGRVSRGHRFLSRGEVTIPTAADYHRVMDESHVLVLPDERREAIRGQLARIAQQDGPVVVDDGSLLEETTFLLEYPTAVRCAFDADFLALPRDVLLLVLRHEQHFFPLASPDGGLLPEFIAVRNGDKAYLGGVREGCEAVARAKLLDALFFFEQDVSRAVADLLEELHGVIFHERLGTLHDKALRVQALAGSLAERLGLPAAESEAVRRAALLCKADLVTAMVTEHPELQGAMGREYARRSGEPEPVAAAIGEHYLPRAAADLLPGTTAGRIVALADKLDTVAAIFAVGLIPTGSEDPYALRREAQGIVRILAEAGYRLPLSALLSETLARLHTPHPQPVEETLAALRSFFSQRVEALLGAAGISYPVVKAVMAVSADIPADALRRAQVIQQRLEDPAFATVARIATRLANITRDFPGDELREGLLTAPAERDLLGRYCQIAPRAAALADAGELEGLPGLLFGLAPAVDAFFEEVMVMADDPDLRQARLALVWRVSQLFRYLGDLSLIPAGG